MRGQEQIEGIINEFFKGMDQGTVMKEFCLQSPDKRFTSTYHCSIKEWMAFIYDKIYNYKGENVLIKEAKKRIFNEKTQKKNIQRPDIQADKDFFSEDELKDAKPLFNVISNLFGHVTVRFILMGMFNVYYADNELKIAINTRTKYFKDHLRRYKIISESQSNQYIPLDRKYLDEIYSIFFTKSFLYLPIKGDDKPSKNAVFFEYSPIEMYGPDDFPGGSIVPSEIYRDDLKLTFMSQYNEFAEDYRKDSCIKFYCECATNLLDIYTEVIRRQVIDELQADMISVIDAEDKINELIEVARLELFHSRSGKDELWKQTQVFLNQLYYRPYNLYAGKMYKNCLFLQYKGSIYRLFVTQKDFEGKNVVFFGGIPSYPKIDNYMYLTTLDTIWLGE